MVSLKVLASSATMAVLCAAAPHQLEERSAGYDRPRPPHNMMNPLKWLPTEMAPIIDKREARIMPDPMPEAMPDPMPEAMPDPMPEAMPEAMPGSFHEKRKARMIPDPTPEAMPDAMPDAMPEALSEAKSDAMPDAMPGLFHKKHEARFLPDLMRPNRLIPAYVVPPMTAVILDAFPYTMRSHSHEKRETRLLPEPMPEAMPKAMPDAMPDPMPAFMPGPMPGHMVPAFHKPYTVMPNRVVPDRTIDEHLMLRPMKQSDMLPAEGMLGIVIPSSFDLPEVNEGAAADE